ncbi:MAG TPA: hypothetical protein VJ932_09450, partial [Alkalispirochaeta sp.]|nr:hypothetical protein [Alkalispirochaeta sp.]
DEADEPAEVEELDELEDASGDEIGELTEDLDEIEAADTAEEVDALEEPAKVEELAELDEQSETDEAAELDEVEELDELDEADEPAEAAELDEVEELAELDELEDASGDEIGEPAEDLDEIEVADTAEEVDALEEPAEVEEFAELDEQSETAEAAEPVEVEELDELDEADEPAEVEELDELEDASDDQEDELTEDIGELRPPEDEPVSSPGVAAGPQISEDWFDISRTALELAEDGEGEAAYGALTGVDQESQDGQVPSATPGQQAGADEQTQLDDVAELEEISDAGEEAPSIVAPTALEESDDWGELQGEHDEPEAIEELEHVAELVPVDDQNEVLEDIAELDAAEDDTSLDEEQIEELDYEAASDDDSEPVDVESIDHQPAPFFSSASSFGAGRAQMQWSSDSDTPGRPSVYRADEIRPEAVALRGIENTNTHHVIDLDDFVAFAGRNQTVIEERDGLIRIEAAAYFGEYRDVDQRTQALAEQVINRHISQGIDAVLGASFGDLDFGDILGTDTPSPVDTAETSDSTLRVVSGGFELPYVDTGGDSGVRQMYRQLVRLTRRWDARVALMLEQTEDYGLRGGFGLGMPEECSAPITLAPTSDLASTIVPYRRVVLLKQPIAAFRDFVGSCHAERLSAINSWLLLPLKDADRRRYLMVGFSRSFDDLLDLAGKYEIIPRAV